MSFHYGILTLLFFTHCTTYAGILDFLCCFKKESSAIERALDVQKLQTQEPIHRTTFPIEHLVNGIVHCEFNAIIGAISPLNKDRVHFDKNLNRPDSQGRLALVEATRQGYPIIIRLLLEAGADSHAKDKRGISAERLAEIGNDSTRTVLFACHKELLETRKKFQQACKKLESQKSSLKKETDPLLADCSAYCGQEKTSEAHLIKLKCSHFLHEECQKGIIKSGSNTCPTCREPFKLTPVQAEIKETATLLEQLEQQRETTIKGELADWNCSGYATEQTIALLPGGKEFLEEQERALDLD